MTTFHLYIVFRLWFWLSLAFGTVTWRGFWQLPAERNKPSTLSTFKWSLSHRWEAWCMLMKLGCVWVQACVGQVGGGWVAAGKTFFDIPPCSKVTKTLSGTRGYIKNDATHKVCTSTSTELALREFTKERFEFKNALLREGKKKPLHKSEKKKESRRRLEVATDLIEVVRTMGWIGSCWCNVPQQKQHTGKRQSLQNLKFNSSVFLCLHQYWKQVQKWFIFYFTKLPWCRRTHLRNLYSSPCPLYHYVFIQRAVLFNILLLSSRRIEPHSELADPPF